MKTDVEELSPTRVKLTIEVPFAELKAGLNKAYREVGKQVRIPGFRPGHVPPRVIDQQLGRGVVLEQAVNDAVPQLRRSIARGQVVGVRGRCLVCKPHSNLRAPRTMIDLAG